MSLVSNKVRFMSLSSGSNGNCYWLEWSGGGILIDAGVSLRALRTGLQTYGIATERIRAVLVTHDHADHILLQEVAVPHLDDRDPSQFYPGGLDDRALSRSGGQDSS